MSKVEMIISERLIYWAQNEEMIDQHYTQHGMDCMEAARLIVELRENGERLMQAADGWKKAYEEVTKNLAKEGYFNA